MDEQMIDFEKEHVYGALYSMHYSGKLLHFYNLNQIKRIQISRGEIILDSKWSNSPESYLVEMIQPFEPQITCMGLNVYIARKTPMDFEINLDWLNF